MNNKENSIKNFKKLSFLKQLALILGLFCIILGIFFVYLSFTGENLKDGTIVEEVTEYIADKPKLAKGEVKVTKDTKYIKDTKYKLKYKNYMNQADNVIVLDPSSSLQIVDVLGSGYTLVKDSIKVNGEKYTNDSKIKVSLEGDNTLKIDIPNNLAINVNEIEVTIKLSDKNEGIKHFTSRDCYFNFIPSTNNKYYEKKTSISYLVDGNDLSYIKLKKN